MDAPAAAGAPRRGWRCDGPPHLGRNSLLWL